MHLGEYNEVSRTELKTNIGLFTHLNSVFFKEVEEKKGFNANISPS